MKSKFLLHEKKGKQTLKKYIISPKCKFGKLYCVPLSTLLSKEEREMQLCLKITFTEVIKNKISRKEMIEITKLIKENLSFQ